MRVADQLKSSGRVVRGRIGVGIAEVTKDVAEPLGLPKAAGALVRSVEPSGPADRGGMEVGDIILKFGDKQIDKASDLPRVVGSTRPGTKVPVQVWRKGSVRDLQLAVGEMAPERGPQAARGQNGGSQPAPAASNALGLTVSDIPDDRKAQLRIKNGVVVDAVEGAGARVGLRPGDVILSLNNQDVVSVRQFNDLVGKLDKARTHVLLVRRGDSASFVPIRPAPSGR
jgi:serine protease Do